MIEFAMTIYDYLAPQSPQDGDPGARLEQVEKPKSGVIEALSSIAAELQELRGLVAELRRRVEELATSD